MRKRSSRILIGFILLIFIGTGISFWGSRLEGMDQPQMERVPMDVSDFQVNQENYSSTFDQTSPSVVVFKDGSFLMVWQDERNGDWDIYAQKFDSSGTAIGTNFEIPQETGFSDQLNPDVARLEDSSFIVVWVEKDEENIYAQKFNPNLSPNGSPIQINETNLPNPSLIKPVLAAFPDEGFVVVWQDTRAGVNIYARRFDSSGSPSNPSFKVNDVSVLPESPSVASDTSGVFVIVWNDSRDGDKDIYFQRYDSDGSSLGSNTIANTDVGTEIQYQPGVTFGKDKDFMITWIDLRNGNDDVYTRLFSWDGAAKIADRKVNSDPSSDGQWFPAVGADSNGVFTVTWADYRGELPAMYVQKYDSNGAVLGPNMSISDTSATGENQMSSIWVNEPGDYVVCWRYADGFDFDIYAQMVLSTGVLKGSNIKVNDDQTGAVQKLPRITADQYGRMLVVWEDQRRGNLKDASDIFVKKFAYNGAIIFDEFQVNDNSELLPQKFPDISAEPLGASVIVWQDSRDGQNIYGQRIDRFGNPQGENFQVNRYQGLSVSTNPSCAMDRFGKFVVVWCGVESGTKNIYAQLFASGGEPVDSSLKVNDDAQAVDHLYPKVAVDWGGNFVVAWYDRRDAQERISLQRYNSAGDKQGDNFALNQDIVNAVEQEFDLDMNNDGIFVLVWIESRSSQAVYAQVYDNSGNPVGSNLLVTDDPLSLPQDPTVSVDNDTFFLITWTDQRDANPNIYYQKFYQDGTSIEDNSIIHNPENSLQMSSDNGVTRTYLCAVWMDNRTSGHGFDIYANVMTYREEVGVDEEFVDNSVSQFHLSQNYPNPFNSTTLIPFTVHSSRLTENGPVHTTLVIYNVLGQKIKTLMNQRKSSGHYEVIWDGKDDSGQEVSSGVYFYRLKSEEQDQIKKLLYLK